MKRTGALARGSAFASFVRRSCPAIGGGRPRAQVAGLASCAMLVLLAGSALAGSTPALSRMVLQASDLPPGFSIIRSLSGSSTNSDVIRMEGRAIAPKLKRWGRISGYRAFYRQRDPVNGKLPGVLAFGAGVALFRTARGAHAALAEPGYGCRDKAFTIIGLGGNRPVGSDTLVCTSPEKIRGVRRARVFLVQWRNGRAAGVVDVLTVEGAVTPLAALTGARKQNRRMTAELRKG